MTPSEVYMRLRQIISDVNLIMSAFESEKYISEANAVLAHEVAKEAFDNGDPNQNTQGNWGQSEDDMFSPIKGNVVFGSAIDGWGFRIQDFAEMYAEKLGARVDALNKALWGDFHYQPKTKSVSKIKAGIRQKATKPMFVQLILEPIYNVFVFTLVRWCVCRSRLTQHWNLIPISKAFLERSSRAEICKKEAKS